MIRSVSHAALDAVLQLAFQILFRVRFPASKMRLSSLSLLAFARALRVSLLFLPET